MEKRGKRTSATTYYYQEMFISFFNTMFFFFPSPYYYYYSYYSLKENATPLNRKKSNDMDSNCSARRILWLSRGAR